MSFTQYKWGVSKPYRALWPILGFSSLRTDYAKVVQINNFLIRIVQKLFKRIKSFRNYVNFSHIIIKTYSIRFYDRPIFSVELFFWIKHLKPLFTNRYVKRKKWFRRRSSPFVLKQRRIKRMLKRKKRKLELRRKLRRKNRVIPKFKRKRKLTPKMKQRRIKRRLKRKKPRRSKRSRKSMSKSKSRKTRRTSFFYKSYQKAIRRLRFKKFSRNKYVSLLKFRSRIIGLSRKRLFRNNFTSKNRYKLLNYPKLTFLLFFRRWNKSKRHRRRSRKKLSRKKKVIPGITALKFRRRMSFKVRRDARPKYRRYRRRGRLLGKKRRRIKRRLKKKKQRLPFRRYRYATVNSRKKRLKLLSSSLLYRIKPLLRRRKTRGLRFNVVCLKKLKYKLNVLNLMSFFKKLRREIQRKRIGFFLSLMSNSFKLLSINVVFSARLISLTSGTVYLYLNHFTKKIVRRREVNPKSLVKRLVRDLKRYKKRLRIKGAVVKARGRFSRRDRAPRVTKRFGKASVSQFRSRTEYSQKEFIFRFGKASIKLVICHAR